MFHHLTAQRTMALRRYDDLLFSFHTLEMSSV